MTLFWGKKCIVCVGGKRAIIPMEMLLKEVIWVSPQQMGNECAKRELTKFALDNVVYIG